MLASTIDPAHIATVHATFELGNKLAAAVVTGDVAHVTSIECATMDLPCDHFGGIPSPLMLALSILLRCKEETGLAVIETLLKRGANPLKMAELPAVRLEEPLRGEWRDGDKAIYTINALQYFALVGDRTNEMHKRALSILLKGQDAAQAAIYQSVFDTATSFAEGLSMLGCAKREKTLDFNPYAK